MTLREGERRPPRVYPELPSRKVAGKRPVDDGRMAFPRAVRLLLYGVDIALFDMVGLPSQLAVWGLILPGQALPLLPPLCDRLQVWPDSREFVQQGRAEARWRGLDVVRRPPWIARLLGRRDTIRGLRGRR